MPSLDLSLRGVVCPPLYKPPAGIGIQLGSCIYRTMYTSYSVKAWKTKVTPSTRIVCVDSMLMCIRSNRLIGRSNGSLSLATESLTLLDNLVRGFLVCMILSNGICRCTVLPRYGLGQSLLLLTISTTQYILMSVRGRQLHLFEGNALPEANNIAARQLVSHKT